MSPKTFSLFPVKNSCDIFIKNIVFRVTLILLLTKISHSLPEPVSFAWQDENIPETRDSSGSAHFDRGEHLTLSTGQSAPNTAGLAALPVSVNSTVLPYPVVSSCSAFIIEFSEAASRYTKCSILYARPLRFCENCINEYIEAKNSYHVIMKGDFHDENGVLCSDAILNSDRIQIVVQTYKFMERIWKDSNCDGCFEVTANSTEHALSNDTLTFLQLANETLECFENYTHGLDVLPFTNITYPLLCGGCRSAYDHMNEFYEHLMEMTEDEICMDIMDMMNSTRLMWSGEFHCSRRTVDIVPIVLLSIFFCTLPVLFYVSNKIHGTKTEKKLLKQKRMKESRMNSVEEEEDAS